MIFILGYYAINKHACNGSKKAPDRCSCWGVDYLASDASEPHNNANNPHITNAGDKER